MKKIFIVLFFLLVPAIIFSGESDYKIGPLLHNKINIPQQEKAKQQFSLQEQTIDSQEPSKELSKVIVVMDRDHLSELPQSLVDELETKVKELGGYIGNHAFNRIQVWISVEKIKELAEWKQIKIIKTSTPAGTNEIISEGANMNGVDTWNNSGYSGKGVKIGVLDGGFSGYSDLIGSELPINTEAIYTGSISDFYSDVHGTACAEIIHDIAPEVDLYLVNAADIDVDYVSAVNWLQSKNVNIISSSYGLNIRAVCYYIHNLLSSSYYNQAYWGTQIVELAEIQESINFKVNQTVSKGITWVQSAGNSAQCRWKGAFYDPDGDGYHNFSGSDELNKISFCSYGAPFYILMSWTAENDFIITDVYDLYIYNDFGSSYASSINNQNVDNIGF